MANKLYEETDIQEIAIATREKTGKTGKMTVRQMSSEIRSIATKSDIKLQEKTASQNGTVTADNGFDGLSKVHVSVPDKTPKLQNKIITENGTYQADSGYDGLGSVTIEVASSGGSSGIVFRNLKESLEAGVSLNTITFSCSYTVA